MKPITFCIIENIITLILFTILAIEFEKWWIVLFSILFMNTIKNEEDK